ncbi:hypothetical protein WJ96_05505 [Burkholderia ubonensis]|uniref:Uncharacterized protein n=1 Tax=Burkholderia ubonensis TaxID=101571 RepID=A0AAW3MYG5_9BURK|nr:hypothetical protein [Burkholderia ubonensis]KVP75214.1 hypothetical protein WJ93_07300 [Burkholderia ubonensis]KVP96684.1 hypothetical protein WJ97_12435 [Burkholderia ubonensis]KVP98027.1 hypothetical protein WJ96_05505 [Burkholderia ubonensis]KVZ92724.1 hypothetical protein WL25_17165 [Burkholderia ubonensis]
MQPDDLFDLRTYLDHEVLSAYSTFQEDALNWWCNPKNETSDMGLDHRTVRAMSTGVQGDRGPVALYEAWAAVQFARIADDAQLVTSVSTREGFEAWHRELTESLVAHWHAQVTANNEMLKHHEGDEFFPENPNLNIAHRYKMVDLFVRYLRVKSDAHPELSRHCYEFGHIPLDRKSLAVISAAFSGIGVGRNFSMGNIISETMYRTYQRLALAICEEAGGTPLLLDVFSWESPFAQKLYEKKPAAPTRKLLKRAKKKQKQKA